MSTLKASSYVCQGGTFERLITVTPLSCRKAVFYKGNNVIVRITAIFYSNSNGTVEKLSTNVDKSTEFIEIGLIGALLRSHQTGLVCFFLSNFFLTFTLSTNWMSQNVLKDADLCQNMSFEIRSLSWDQILVSDTEQPFWDHIISPKHCKLWSTKKIPA